MSNLEAKRDRFKGASWFENARGCNVIIGGNGGIGSFLTFLLTRTGFVCHTFDDDIVEIHNLSGQMFKVSDIGSSKVGAVARLVKELTGDVVYTNECKYTEDSITHHIMLSGFDNMAARKIMFENWVKHIKSLDKNSKEYKQAIFIDGRVTPEVAQVYCVTPDRIEQFNHPDHLFNDSEVSEGVCTFKQTTYCASFIASAMTSFLVNHIDNYGIGAKVMAVPFFWEYNFNLNNAKNTIRLSESTKNK